MKERSGWPIILFSLLIIFSLGCGLFTKLFQAKQTALSTTPPELPAPPKPATLLKGTPEEQAVYFADLLELPENCGDDISYNGGPNSITLAHKQRGKV